MNFHKGLIEWLHSAQLSALTKLILFILLVTNPALSKETQSRYAAKSPEERYSFLYGHAQEGNTLAQHRLAMMCLNGEGTLKDPIEAVKWFRLAAQEGNPKSQFQLALALLSGNGVGEDKLEAIKWLRLAADQNSPNALYILGNMYLNGENVDRDNRTAYKLFKKSAELGFTRSLLKQADMLIRGMGIEKNVYKGIVLYKNAAESGDEFAKSKLPDLENQKLCLFSAKTQLFGKYLKCANGKDFRLQVLEKGAKLLEKRSNRYKKVYSSERVLKGSKYLELYFISSDKLARLRYTFEHQSKNEKQIGKLKSLTTIKNILENKYGRYRHKEGVLGAGKVKYSWQLKDNITIALSQNSSRSDMILEYLIPSRMKIFQAEQDAEKNTMTNESYAFDREVF